MKQAACTLLALLTISGAAAGYVIWIVFEYVDFMLTQIMPYVG